MCVHRLPDQGHVSMLLVIERGSSTGSGPLRHIDIQLHDAYMLDSVATQKTFEILQTM